MTVKPTRLFSVLAFLVAAVLNVVVFTNFSESIWVKFKVFGMMGIQVVFLGAQIFWIASQLGDEDLPSSEGDS